MNLDELRSEVALGEDSHRQFKRDAANADSLAAEMAAFANLEGGVILLGVEDDGSLPGLDRADVARLNQLIGNAASQHVRSPLTVRTENVRVAAGRLVIVLTVPKGIDKPYFDRNGVIWLKSGADKRRVNSREELSRLFQSAGQFHADELPTKAGLDKLDRLRFRDFLRDTYQRPFPEDPAALATLLQNMNLATEGGTLNLAGVMLFAERPEWILPQFIVKAILFPGKTIHPTTYADSEDFAGPLPRMFEGAMGFVMRHMPKVQGSRGVNSPGRPEIPSAVFEELLVNALVHRDYLVSAPVRLLIFEDRIEIISPGHLPDNLTVAKIRAGNSNIRNPILVSFAAKGLLPYRGLGSGITRALEHWPDIEFQDDREGCLFTAIIRRHAGKELSGRASGAQEGSQEINEKGASGQKGSQKSSQKGSQKSSQKILALMALDAAITIATLATTLELTDRAVKKQIAQLKATGQLRRVGPDKGGHWEVTR